MKKTKSMKRFRIGSLFKWALLIFLAVFELFPLLLVISNAFRTDSEVKQMPIGLPNLTYYQNFVDTWTIGEYGRAYINTFFIAAVVIVLILVIDGLAAYALAKLHLKLKNVINGYFFVAMSLPGFLYIIPVYSAMRKMGLVDTYWGIIIVYTAGQIPFNLILLRTFLTGIPRELEEAAKIDGCTELQSFIQITVPIAKSIFMTIAILVFSHVWNEYLWANTFLPTDELKTVATRYVRFTGQYTSNMARIYTASVIAIVPICALYLAFSRKFIEGLTSGSVKG